MLYKIIYSSEQTRPILKQDLSEIIASAVRNNQKYDITGCLLFHKPYFAQVLEGDTKKLTELIDVLRVDTRHKNIKVSSLIAINQRTFGDWHMTLASKDPLSTEFLRVNLGLDTFDPSKIKDEDLFELIKKVK
ncbi:MAG: BLUF domain-containing protein [Oligoflexales bacterium]